MQLDIKAVTRTAVTAAGGMLAGPAGAMIGSFVGGLVGSILPGAGGIATSLANKLTTKSIETVGARLTEALSEPEKQQINHDLQTAFRDACREALYDLGGRECFPELPRTILRDVPDSAVYPKTGRGQQLWHSKDPLADQVKDLFQYLKTTLDAGRLLPLDPPAGVLPASAITYLQAETPAGLEADFFEVNFTPYLGKFSSLLQELPDLEPHLRRNLYPRMQVHLGENLKHRTEAWRAFNRMVLQSMEVEIRQVSEGQNEILQRLESVLQQPGGVGQWADSTAELLSATGALERKVEEGFDSLTSRVIAQHGELVARFDTLMASSDRIESKVDRVLRFLEDGSYIIEGQATVPVAKPPAPGEAPYKGLQYFSEVDSDLFFGRDELIGRLAERLNTTRFLAVIGASGSGKSSVVRAGLLPLLRGKKVMPVMPLLPAESTLWQYCVITPSAHPLESLAAAVSPPGSPPSVIQQIEEEIRQNPAAFAAVWRKFIHPSGARRGLLVVDQFEEVFTLCQSATDQKAFADALMHTVDLSGNSSPMMLIIILRADFYADCARFDALREALAAHQEFIGPMSETELRRAIEEPALRHGWKFEPGLVDLILRDVGREPGALPLLSHALLETWRNRSSHTMTLESYAISGGVHGAIAKTAEYIYNQRLTSAQQQIARSIFLRLTNITEESHETRRRASLDELIPSPTQAAQVEQVLELLTEARLVTTSEDSAELAHEALIREWPKLRGWLEDNQAGLRLHHRLAEHSLEWQRMQYDEGLLYRGARLAEVLEWSAINQFSMNELERRFVQTSKELADREAAEKESARRRELESAQKLAQTEAKRAEEQAASAKKLRQRAVYLSGALAAAGVLLFLALAFGVTSLFFGQRASRNADLAQQNAQTAQAEANTRATAEAAALLQKATAEVASEEALLQSQIALARELGAQAQSMAFRNEDTALLLAVQGVKTANRANFTIPQPQTALYNVLEVANFEHILIGHTERVWGGFFSLDNKLIVTASMDGTAMLWDLDGNHIATLSGHTGELYSAIFSPDGKQILTAGQDGTIRLWDLDGNELKRITGHNGIVPMAIFSADGKWILSTGEDKTARLWHSDGTPAVIFEGAAAGVSGATFSPDGSLVATTAFDNIQRIYRLDGSLVSELKGHTGWAPTIAFSPDSKMILTAGWDGHVYLWDVQTGAQIREFAGHPRSVNTAVFSPDGKRVLTACNDTFARLYDLDGTLLNTLEGHTGPVSVAFFDPSGEHILTASWDGTSRLWTGEGAYLSTLEGHTDTVLWAIFSPDGRHILTSSRDQTARLYRVENLFRRLITGQTGTISWGDFSPNGEMFVIGGQDSSINLYRADGSLIRSFGNLSGPVFTVRFNPAGNRILVAGFTNQAHIYTLDGTLETTFEGHTESVTSAAYSPKGDLVVTTSYDGTARIYAVNGKLLAVLNHDDAEWVNFAAFSPDGSLIATAAADFLVRLWKSDGTLVRGFLAQDSPVASAIFSPDGTRILTAGYDPTARMFDLEGNLLFTMEGHTDLLSHATFSPDGKFILTTSNDSTGRLWRAKDGAFIAALEGHTSWLTGGAFSPDGTRLLTTSWDGSTRLWGVYGDLDQMLTTALKRLNGLELSDVGCQKYLHMDTCPTD